MSFLERDLDRGVRALAGALGLQVGGKRFLDRRLTDSAILSNRDRSCDIFSDDVRGAFGAGRAIVSDAG
jgi:hypothetical protein